MSIYTIVLFVHIIGAIGYFLSIGSWLFILVGLRRAQRVEEVRALMHVNDLSRAVGGVLDKTWIVCDNTPTSPFFGHCYAQWDSPNASDLLQMSTSANGGASWKSAVGISSEKTVYFMMM
jgi:hypothetical protein